MNINAEMLELLKRVICHEDRKLEPKSVLHPEIAEVIKRAETVYGYPVRFVGYIQSIPRRRA